MSRGQDETPQGGAPGAAARAIGLERMSRRGLLLLAGPGALVTALLAGALAPVKAEPRPLDVVATTSMIADAVRQIGGERAQVRALMGPGVDPHGYRQTRTDIAALTRADLALWHGLYLEAQMERFMLELAGRRTVVAVAEALPRDLLLAHEDYEGKYDPHIWMNPALWNRVVLRVRDTLVEARPQWRAEFEANTERFRAEIAALDAYSRETLATVPPEARVLVTAHDAFGYFGAAYGFEVVGIQGISTESEAGVNRIREMVQMLVSRRIGAVFIESSVPDRNVRALIEGAAARGHKVVIGGELFSDAMGPGDSYEGTYIGMIDHNVTTIARALGGTAPARGMQGKLQGKLAQGG